MKHTVQINQRAKGFRGVGAVKASATSLAVTLMLKPAASSISVVPESSTGDAAFMPTTFTLYTPYLKVNMYDIKEIYA